MITEDYVSLEIARLLKDKGFNEYCMAFRSPSGALFRSSHDIKNFEDGKTIGGAVAAPTIQMAMKWLREVHNLYIDIRININNSLYSFQIYSVGISGARAFTEYRIKPYEAACEEAINYCLKNLI